MKKILVLVGILVLGGSVAMAKTKDLKQPFGKGEVNPYSQFFTNTTYLNMLVAEDDVYNITIGNVTFDASARTNWHTHSGGQILLVTSGEGRYQEKGKAIQILKVGDVVKIAPDVMHWHGAAPKRSFSLIAIQPNSKSNTTTWLEPVSAAEYK